MRRAFLSAFVVAVISAVVLPARAGTSWKAFSPEGGGFTVVMPGTPTYQQKTDSSPIGHIGEHIWTVQNGTLTVTAEYSDLPELAVVFGGHHEIYKKTFQAFLKDVGGAELGVQKFMMLGYTGEELSYRTATRTGKVRTILVHKRLFVMQASAVKGSGEAASVDRYLASFQLHYQKAPAHPQKRSWRRGGNKR